MDNIERHRTPPCPRQQHLDPPRQVLPSHPSHPSPPSNASPLHPSKRNALHLALPAHPGSLHRPRLRHPRRRRHPLHPRAVGEILRPLRLPHLPLLRRPLPLPAHHPRPVCGSAGGESAAAVAEFGRRVDGEGWGGGVETGGFECGCGGLGYEMWVVSCFSS